MFTVVWSIHCSIKLLRISRRLQIDQLVEPSIINVQYTTRKQLLTVTKKLITS